MDVVSVVKTVALLPVTALSCILRAGLQLLTWKPRWTPTPSHAVMVTGCDRGLGFSLALHCRSLGMTVFAGVMDLNSAGAYLLDEHGVFVFRLDVTDPESVESAVEYVKQALQEDPRMRLAALVNNAGVLVFGEFGWLTWRQVALQLDVNLAGTLRVSRAFLPLLRRDHGRLMVVTSHCAFMPLPAVSVYTASKAGLQAWADALRIEEAQYDVPVIQVVPGSFTHLSGILATQGEHAKEMMDAMSDEDRQFYGDYPQRFNTYIGEVGAMGQKAVREPAKLPDEKLHKMFEEALFSVRPQHRYVHEPWRYTFYHSLFKLAPECARDWIVLKFTSLPSFKQS